MTLARRGRASNVVVTCALALVALGPRASAQQASRPGELLIAPVPSGWKVGSEDTRGANQQVTELIPEDQTLERWTRMITVQTYRGATDRDPMDMVAGLADRLKRLCPGLVVDREPQGPSQPERSLRGSLRCQGGESKIVLAIQGRDAFYYVLYQWRGAEDATAELRAGNAYLDTVRVCDARTTGCGDLQGVAVPSK